MIKGRLFPSLPSLFKDVFEEKQAYCPPLFTVSLLLTDCCAGFLQLLLSALFLLSPLARHLFSSPSHPSLYFHRNPLYLNSCLPCVIFQGLEGLCTLCYPLAMEHLFPLCMPCTLNPASSVVSFISVLLDFLHLLCSVLPYRWKTELQTSRNPRLPSGNLAAKYRCLWGLEYYFP